jgi:glycosyltransferase involved in cell wall biosynthesis
LYVERLIREIASLEAEHPVSPHFTVALSDHENLRAFAGRLAEVAQVHSFPFEKLSSLPGTVAKLRRMAAQHDVVHINSNHPGSRLGILMGFALPGAGTPVVSVEHGGTAIANIEVPRSIAWALPTLFRWSRHRVARVIAVSEENRRTLTELYRLPPEKVTVVHNGIDLRPFAGPLAPPSLRRELGLGSEQPLILFLGRLRPNKGYPYLLEAAPTILARFPTTHFVLAGSPEDRVAAEAQIARLGIQGHVSILGFRSDVVNLLYSADLFVLPSLAEGFSLAILEAMAAGVPVVATRVGGAAEIIEEGRNGFLVPPADSETLSRAIQRALDLDSASREVLRQAARERAACFSLSATAQGMLDIYTSLTS